MIRERLASEPAVECLKHGRMQRVITRAGRRVQVCEACGHEMAVIALVSLATVAPGYLTKRDRLAPEPDASCARHGKNSRQIVRAGALVTICEECGHTVDAAPPSSPATPSNQQHAPQYPHPQPQRRS